VAVYLGISSNWSFTRRILNMTHEYIYHRAVPSPGLIFDGETYELEFASPQSASDAHAALVPMMDHAIHLINTVKFHCCQLFHLFDETEFMGLLHEFYAQTPQPALGASLWGVHFLVLLALGKAFLSKSQRGRQPPGAEFFIRAMQLLPNMVILWRDPIRSTEALCCIALYLQCIDYRISAHNFVSSTNDRQAKL